MTSQILAYTSLYFIYLSENVSGCPNEIHENYITAGFYNIGLICFSTKDFLKKK